MLEPPPQQDHAARQVVQSAYAVHVALGPGLLESVYEHCLVHELGLRGATVRRQVAVPITYKDAHLDAGLRMDLVVDDLVVVKVKAVEKLLPVHQAQVLTYLRLSRMRLGILVNFNVPLLKNGIHRLILPM